MSDLAFDALAGKALAGVGAVPSPCVSVCQMNPRTGWCEGCFRTIDEIASWSALDEADKRRVWAQLTQRQATQTPGSTTP